MNSSAQYQCRCRICDQAFVSTKRSAKCCARKECRALLHFKWAEFYSFLVLRSACDVNRWLGGKSQKQLLSEYYRWRLREAVEALEQGEAGLVEVLVEIAEDLEE
jgi:hypothetical protein